MDFSGNFSIKQAKSLATWLTDKAIPALESMSEKDRKEIQKKVEVMKENMD